MTRGFALPFTAVLAAAGLLAASCSPTGDGGRPADLPASPPVVAVTLREYRFHLDPDVPAGRVVFRIRNAGKVAHRPALLPLEEDLPPLDEQLRGPVRLAVSPFAGVRTRAPGARGAFAVDLVPGTRYGLICFIRDPDGSSHALKGMSFEFRAPRPPSSSRR